MRKTSVGRDFQNNVLGQLIERNQMTTIYLRNRMSLRGRVIDYDPYVLLLDPIDGGPPNLVYKSAIVSISGPQRPAGRPRRPDRPPRPYPARDREPIGPRPQPVTPAES